MRKYLGTPSGSKSRRMEHVAVAMRITIAGGRTFEIVADGEEWVRCSGRWTGYLVTFWRHGMMVAAVKASEFRDMQHLPGRTEPVGTASPGFAPALDVTTVANYATRRIAGYAKCEWLRRPRYRYRAGQRREGVRWTWQDGRTVVVAAREISVALPAEAD